MYTGGGRKNCHEEVGLGTEIQCRVFADLGNTGVNWGSIPPGPSEEPYRMHEPGEGTDTVQARRRRVNPNSRLREGSLHRNGAHSLLLRTLCLHLASAPNFLQSESQGQGDPA